MLIVVAGFLSCNMQSGSGNIVSQDRNLANFTGIRVGGDFEVKLRQGETYSVRVEADDNLINDIKTTVKNNDLVISYKSNVNLRNAHMTIWVTSPVLNNIRTSASAELTTEGTIRSNERIKLNASSGSNIKADLDAPAIEAGLSSGAEMDLKGRTRDLQLEASSGASADAFSLKSENTIARVSSGASMDVYASVSLEARASSGGTISYKGAAKVIRKENSGGNVSQKD